MGRIILLAGMALATTAAWAATGVVTGKGSSAASQVEACASAKENARLKAQLEAGSVSRPATITSFGSCMCEQDEDSSFWHCIVDANYRTDEEE